MSYAGWNKGLNKHTNESVRIGVEKRTGIIRKDRGTKRGFSGFANKTHSDLAKDAISSSLAEQHASGSRNAGYEKIRLSKIGVTKENSQGRKNQSEWMKNRIVSDETRKKNSAAFVGRIWVTNGQTSKMIYPAELDAMVGWKKGRK